MDVINRTAFPALAFEGLDTQDRPFHVLVMRITYVLSPGAGTEHCTHHLDFADDQAPLAATDSFLGDPPGPVLVAKAITHPSSPDAMCSSWAMPMLPAAGPAGDSPPP